MPAITKKWFWWNDLFWERGKRGLSLGPFGQGGSYPRNGPTIKKKTFDLWNWWLNLTGKLFGREIISAKKSSFFPPSLRPHQNMYPFWGIFSGWRHICLSKFSPNCFGAEIGDWGAQIPTIGPDNLYISFCTLVSTQNQSL